MDRTQDSLLLSVQLSGPVLASEEPQLGFQKPSLGIVLVYDDDDVVCTPANHLSEGFPSVFLGVGSRLTSLQFAWLTKQKKHQIQNQTQALCQLFFRLAFITITVLVLENHWLFPRSRSF